MMTEFEQQVETALRQAYERDRPPHRVGWLAVRVAAAIEAALAARIAADMQKDMQIVTVEDPRPAILAALRGTRP